MTSIELPEDYAQPARVTVGQTLLRIVLGVLLIYHAVQRWFGFEALADELAVRFALLEAAEVAQLVIGLEIAAGVGLILGWFTRLSALVLLGSVGLSVTLEVMRQGGGWATAPAARFQVFELPAVQLCAGLFFLLAGPGPASVRDWLRARARRKAIENDETWSRHPYVPSPELQSYEHSYERSYDYDDEYRRRPPRPENDPAYDDETTDAPRIGSTRR
jgi:uncharacterized membrane protein YphA (DoxX/SURF4 family)